ncbi:hypothetical protein BKA61DRAFT_618857 [Leptodontidium sp. MPI-SDFR-AT-0119]|nr:hypothetical protein BKA61DRAFT_618857 [Leptodontidium sp. MPI-SDFR-AT-0119]
MSLPDISCLTNSTHKYKTHRFHPPPSDQSALLLYIPPCHQKSHHRLHLPSPDQPLRIQVEGPPDSTSEAASKNSWHTADHSPIFTLPGAGLYTDTSLNSSMIDYYGSTFNHLVPIDHTDPEVLQINIEIEDDGGIYANKSSCFEIDPAVFTGKKVPALRRCCRKRKGAKDRRRVNDAVNMRDWRA